MDQTVKIHVIEDCPFERDWLKDQLSEKFPETTVHCSKDFIAFLDYSLSPSDKNEIIILDLHLTDSEKFEGLELIEIAKRKSRSANIIVRSSADTPSTIKKVLDEGADDFVSKNDPQEVLFQKVHQALRRLLAQESETELSNEKYFLDSHLLHWHHRVPNIMKSAIRNIHLFGASGTGKEVYADVLQSQLTPATPFVRVNCAAVSQQLMESELFGHVRGSFTGATKDKKGVFEIAHKGWLFLDEIACLNEEMQSALLRAIENREIQKVGSSHVVKVDVRILSATNLDLSEQVKSGKFRLDLWQRLCESTVTIPTLADSDYDLDSLIKHICKNLDGGPYTISTPTINLLKCYSWKDGNLRELRNCLRAMTENHTSNLLTPASIPKEFLNKIDPHLESFEWKKKTPSLRIPFDPHQSMHFEEHVNDLLLSIMESLKASGQKITSRRLAAKLGIARGTLTRRLHALSAQSKLPAHFKDLVKLPITQEKA